MAGRAAAAGLGVVGDVLDVAQLVLADGLQDVGLRDLEALADVAFLALARSHLIEIISQ